MAAQPDVDKAYRAGWQDAEAHYALFKGVRAPYGNHPLIVPFSIDAPHWTAVIQYRNAIAAQLELDQGRRAQCEAERDRAYASLLTADEHADARAAARRAKGRLSRLAAPVLHASDAEHRGAKRRVQEVEKQFRQLCEQVAVLEQELSAVRSVIAGMVLAVEADHAR